MDKKVAMVRIWLRGIMMSMTAIFVAGLSPSFAGAAEFSLKPSIIVREEYDDNIFLTQNDRESDYITRVLPSVKMKYGAPLWDWELDYTLNWWYYAKLREGKTSHYANLVSKTKLIQNFLYLDVFDTYTSVVLNPRRASTENNLLENRSDSNVLTASPYIKYQIDPSLALSTGYRYTNIWYREDSGVKRQMHTGFVTADFLISPVLTLNAGADYTLDRPEKTDSDNADSDQVSVFAGAIYKIGPTVTANGTLGCRWINFDGQGHDDTTRPVYNIGLSYRFAEKGQVDITAVSVIIQSPENGIYDSRMEKIAVGYGDATSIKGSVYHRYDIYLEEDRKDDVYGVTAVLEYRPDQRLTFGVGGSYEWDKYLPQHDRRNIYTAAASIDYKLTAKASLGVTYNYNKSDGDNENDNYTENMVGLQLRIEI